MYTLKSGVDISKLHPTLTQVLTTLDLLWQAFFPKDLDGMTVTSGHEGNKHDGTHAEDSKHYLENSDGQGEAVDIRLNDVLQWRATEFCGLASLILSRVYGDIFKCYFENALKQTSHFHVQLKD